MAHLFDNRLVSILVNGALAPGARLYFYTAGTATPATTYTTPGLDAGAVNTNPLLADANGRFAAVWLAQGSYKFVLATPGNVTLATVDSYSVAADPPTFDSDLDGFLAGDLPLSIVSGGTGATSAADARNNLGAVNKSGDTVGALTKAGQGAYLAWVTSGQTSGRVFITAAAAADPTSLPGDIWLKY